MKSNKKTLAATAVLAALAPMSVFAAGEAFDPSSAFTAATAQIALIIAGGAGLLGIGFSIRYAGKVIKVVRGWF